MVKTSFGILLFKRSKDQIFVLLAHPGGPFWADKDLWTLPKGEPSTSDSDGYATARREFSEETGLPPPEGDEFIDLGELAMSGMVVANVRS